LLSLVTILLALPGSRAHAGTVRAWGNNSEGQCNVPLGLSATAAAAGGLHSLAVRDDGTVVAWGWNLLGETNVPADLNGVVAVDGNYGFSVALKADGTVRVWGTVGGPPPPGLTNVTAVSAGWEHTLALLADGTVATWGNAPEPPPGLSNVLAVAAGNGHSLALRSDGKVMAWGDNAAGKASVPSTLSNVVAIAAGDDHNLALRSDGRVVAWGDNSFGQCSVPVGLTGVVAVAAGSGHSLALRANGAVVAWGRNDFGQASPPPALTNVIAISGGAYHSLALLGDGAPAITVQPFGQSVYVSRPATFRVFATGLAPLAYQWRRNGTNLAGATSSALQINNVQPSDAGAYSVVITNLLGAVTSAPAVLTPLPTPPLITVQPQDATTFCGEGATFRVTADGSRPFTYQWQFEGTDLPGATSSALTLSRVSTNAAGNYTVVVSNAFGSVTSRQAVLTVEVEPPLITSPLVAAGKQGVAFNYTLTGRHGPTLFSALGLPAGLEINPTNGVIQGVPLESGLFNVQLGTANACASDAAVLALTIAPSVPVITSATNTVGTEGEGFLFQITATDSPTSFGAQNLPAGLRLDTASGVISGVPVYPGDFDATVTASNQWGVGTGPLHFTFANRTIPGLAIANVTYSYSSPYVLDFQFSLRDNEDPALANPVVVNPTNLVVVCKEDDRPISPAETAYLLSPGAGVRKLVKVNLVLDFSQSIASLRNGDTNGDGISDAVDTMVAAAQEFVDRLTPGSQVGVYEFHREDMDPQQVLGLTTDRTAVNAAIAGIWTNYVAWFPAGSRCWDALLAAINGLGTTNSDEQHYVVFVSDGRDESSAATVDDVIGAATNNNVRVYCLGFGAEQEPNDLLAIATTTAGRYYAATNVAGLATEFAQIGKDISGQYLLRWTTLKRGTTAFMPSFEIRYQDWTAFSPTNPVWTNFDDPIIDTNSTPPTTNYPLVTNYIIGWYVPADHAGDVKVGSLRLVADAAVGARAITLRATYVPRYIRQLRFYYRPNWPCTVSLLSDAPGELLHGWTLSETNDGAGGRWLDLSSPYPPSLTNSLPYGAFGSLLQFNFRDIQHPSNAFSAFSVDNSLYTNTGQQRFVIENTNQFVTVYPALPFGTPVPWLVAHGFTNNLPEAEVSDPDADGALTWQEYRADTDPRDAGSVFAAQLPAPTGPYGHYQIAFPTSSNRAYRVETSVDLLLWDILADNLPGTGGVLTVTDPRSPWNSPYMFYRVLVW